MEINSLDDLITFRENVNRGTTYEGLTVNLNVDVDLSSLNWFGIGYVLIDSYPFKGTFNGNNHVINNLNIKTSGTMLEPYTGFFGYCESATIKNLIIKNANVEAESSYTTMISILCGYCIDNITISNIHIEGTIKHTSGYDRPHIGSLIGYYIKNSSSNNLSITYCTSFVDFDLVNSNVGFLVGSTDGSNINVINHVGYAGTVYVSGCNVGGLTYEQGQAINNSYSCPKYILRGNCTLLGLFYQSNTSNKSTRYSECIAPTTNGYSITNNYTTSTYATVKTHDEFKNGTVKSLLGNGFYMTRNRDYPVCMKEKETVYINNYNDLLTFKNDIDNGYEYELDNVYLTNDINMMNRVWTPIGTSTYKFKGTLDGQNHTISNMFGYNTNNFGFFYTLNGATIKNVRFDNCKIKVNINSSEQYLLSIIATRCNNTTIDKCIISNVNVDVYCPITNYRYASICCFSNNDIISNCLVYNCNVKCHGSMSRTAGFISQNDDSNSTINNCGFIGDFDFICDDPNAWDSMVAGIVAVSYQKLDIKNTFAYPTFHYNITAQSQSTSYFGNITSSNYSYSSTSDNVYSNTGNISGSIVSGKTITTYMGSSYHKVKNFSTLSTGELCYLLGSNWYQRINIDKYPYPIKDDIVKINNNNYLIEDLRHNVQLTSSLYHYDVKYISSKYDIINMVKRSTERVYQTTDIVLLNDIDMEGYVLECPILIDCNIDGRGFKIKNFKILSTSYYYYLQSYPYSYNYSLFYNSSITKDLTIKNLTIENSSIIIQNLSTTVQINVSFLFVCFMSATSGYSKIIENCHIKQCYININQQLKFYYSGIVYISSSSTSQIINCSSNVKGIINVENLYYSSICYCINTVNHAVSNDNVKIITSNNCYLSGICQNPNNVYNSICSSLFDVIVLNYSTICGICYSSFTVKNCVFNGIINVENNYYMYILGLTNNCINNISNGIVNFKGNRIGIVYDIFGNNSISNCLSNSTINIDVKNCEDTSSIYCLYSTSSYVNNSINKTTFNIKYRNISLLDIFGFTRCRNCISLPTIIYDIDDTSKITINYLSSSFSNSYSWTKLPISKNDKIIDFTLPTESKPLVYFTSGQSAYEQQLKQNINSSFIDEYPTNSLLSQSVYLNNNKYTNKNPSSTPQEIKQQLINYGDITHNDNSISFTLLLDDDIYTTSLTVNEYNTYTLSLDDIDFYYYLPKISSVMTKDFILNNLSSITDERVIKLIDYDFIKSNRERIIETMKSNYNQLLYDLLPIDIQQDIDN